MAPFSRGGVDRRSDDVAVTDGGEPRDGSETVTAAGRPRARSGDLGPGLGVAALGVALAYAAHRLLPSAGPLSLAVLFGVVLGNLPVSLRRLRPGLDYAARRLLRIGIVLLGLRLAVVDVLELGAPGLLVVTVVVAVTFVGTQWLGRRLGLSAGASLLVATGFSICGASAVAAMDGVTRNRREDVATAIALVTLFGSLAILVLPLLQHPLGLSDVAFGTWAGASVHDVAQTVATASGAGSGALAAAVVVKLTRVVLLAPMVAGVSLWQRRRSAADPVRPPIVPLFVLGFLAAVVARSTGVLPESALSAGTGASNLVLAAALFGLGTSVHLRSLVRTGGRALVLGLLSWLTISCAGYAGIRLIGM